MIHIVTLIHWSRITQGFLATCDFVYILLCMKVNKVFLYLRKVLDQSHSDAQNLTSRLK